MLGTFVIGFLCLVVLAVGAVLIALVYKLIRKVLKS